MEQDISAVVATIKGRIAIIDKVRDGLVVALRRADADLAAVVATEPSPNRSRKTAVMNGGNVMPAPGARTGPD